MHHHRQRLSLSCSWSKSLESNGTSVLRHLYLNSRFGYHHYPKFDLEYQQKCYGFSQPRQISLLSYHRKQQKVDWIFWVDQIHTASIHLCPTCMLDQYIWQSLWSCSHNPHWVYALHSCPRLSSPTLCLSSWDISNSCIVSFYHCNHGQVYLRILHPKNKQLLVW